MGELDTGFNLSKAGAHGRADRCVQRRIVSSLTYPALSSDTSYGPAETVAKRTSWRRGPRRRTMPRPVTRWARPGPEPGFNDSSWASGPTGLGYTGRPRVCHHALQGKRLGTVGQRRPRPKRSSARPPTRVRQSTRPRACWTSWTPAAAATSPTPASRQAFPGMTIGEGLSNYRLAGHGNAHDHVGPGRILHLRRQQRRRIQR